MKKNVLFVAIVFAIFGSANLSAQNADEAIMLPDVSTEIQGGAPKAGKSAVPDYSSVIPERQTSELVPRLPDAVLSDDSSIQANISNQNETSKSIYAEGLAGVGYPGFFTGNFSVYNQTGPNPFKIAFSHETLNGYARNDLTSGFFDRNTQIEAEKTFSFDKANLVFSGLYKSLTDGLQNQSENISDVTRDFMSAGGDFSVSLPKNLELSANLNGSWYKRYGTIIGNPQSEIPDFAEQINLVDLIPFVSFGHNANGFSVGLDAEYNLYFNAKGSFDENVENRGEFSLNLGYENSFFEAKGIAGFVVGSNIGENSILVPFKVQADFKIPVNFSPRNLKLSLYGGLDSFAPKIDVLENENAFSAINVIPEETSDWFGGAEFSFPIKDLFTFNASGEFRKTAFDNGTWTSDYDNEDARISGLYTFSKKDMTQLNTKLNVSYKSAFGVFGGNWESRWLDKAEIEAEQFLSFNYSFQSGKSFFTLDALLGFSPTDDDKVPVLDFEASFKLSNAVRLAFTGNDIVKLISGDSRDYAGSYISRSGNAGVLVKFVF